jgi:hypothetical protein
MVIGCFQMPQEAQESSIFIAADGGSAATKSGGVLSRRLDLVAAARRY